MAHPGLVNAIISRASQQSFSLLSSLAAVEANKRQILLVPNIQSVLRASMEQGGIAVLLSLLSKNEIENELRNLVTKMNDES